ncbi:hypothetical protein HanXRQr2_Chr02g0066201 [Helianthus annuus]|uniref:Uncharacterized protein n=1 Tax=Helianthus annuus TaxID=4232 RepID=A0A9K3JPZ1_HELAN|nr:hypothetical protein HanXRQr2_Chr02g0066201 [Helianthus annuus]
MHHERADWEGYRERFSEEAKEFEKAEAEFAKLKAEFEAKKKKEEWGLLGMKRKLQASEDTLAEERRKWREACEWENQRMYSARTEIANLKAQFEALTKSKADFEERYEAAKSHRERAEILQVDLEEQLISKDRDMVDKNLEITDVTTRLFGSLLIDVFSLS